MLELKDLIESARQNPTDEAIHDLWQAMFRLQAWYFLPAQDVEGPSTPLVTEVDDKMWVLAFANFRRISDFARQVGRRRENGEIHMLVLNPLEAVNELRGVREHVAGVIFNARSDESFRVPIDAIEEYATFFGLPLDG